VNVVESLPGELVPLFLEVVGSSDQRLLESLYSEPEPSRKERELVEEILGDEFSRCLQPDFEPTARGLSVVRLIEAFLTRWPIEGA